jgi:hypothetical protein
MLGGRVVRSLETYVCKGSLPREWCGYVVLETVKQEQNTSSSATYGTAGKPRIVYRGKDWGLED